MAKYKIRAVSIDGETVEGTGFAMCVDEGRFSFVDGREFEAGHLAFVFDGGISWMGAEEFNADCGFWYVFPETIEILPGD